MSSKRMALPLLLVALAAVCCTSREPKPSVIEESDLVTQHAGPLSLTVVLDSSASMSERGRLEQAKSAIVLLAWALEPGDRISVVTAGSPPRLALAPSPVAEARLSLPSQLESTKALGQTDLVTSLRLAAKALAGEPTSNRYCVVLSDGRLVYDEDKVGEAISELKGLGTPVMGVAFGDFAHDPPIKRLASIAGSYFFQVYDAPGLLRVLAAPIDRSLRPPKLP